MSQMPTLMDVAQLAGVSYATADRVVNARAGVAAKSRKKVEAAIAQLGYVRNVAAANLSQGRVHRFGFVLPAGDNAFFDQMRRIIAQKQPDQAPPRPQVEILDVDAFDLDALCARLQALRSAGFDGLAVVGIDHPRVTAALRELQASGCAIVTLVSHVQTDGAAPYVGVDNYAAGRTAARLIGMAHAVVPGLVQIILGSRSLRDHAERLDGACNVLTTDYPAVTQLPPLEGLDQGELVQRLLSERLRQYPNITAIYAVGAGSDGVVDALRGHHPTGLRPFCVLHELTPSARDAVETGLVDAVIDQQPEHEVERAFALMRCAADRLPLPENRPITPAIYLKDNLPPLISHDERPAHDRLLRHPLPSSV